MHFSYVGRAARRLGGLLHGRHRLIRSSSFRAFSLGAPLGPLSISLHLRDVGPLLILGNDD
eukprot:6780553-Heterocapsa_arctica.AAC.1